MSASISPGPWRWTDADDDTYEPGILAREDGIQIGFRRSGGKECDARLIAAAPEMFALLRRIIGCWPNHHLAPDFVREGHALLARIEDAT